MTKESLPIGVIPIIVITWILSLITTLAIVYVAPTIFPIAVTADNIADSAIITTKLADGNVTSAKILDGNLTAVDIADGSILTIKVADGAVTTTKMAAGAVTTDKMSDGAVATAKIANSAIVTIKLADGSVTSAKIRDGTVTAIDLADNSIITARIANGAVTSEKIAEGAVTTSKIADGSITNMKLTASAIPYNVTSFDYLDDWITTTSTSWVNMTGTSVNITVTRNSTLLIMFSAMGRVDTAGEYMYWHSMVNSTEAYPTSFYNVITHNATNYGTHTCNFYKNVTAGTYTVYMQWKTWYGFTARVRERTLFVIAFPA